MSKIKSGFNEKYALFIFLSTCIDYKLMQHFLDQLCFISGGFFSFWAPCKWSWMICQHVFILCWNIFYGLVNFLMKLSLDLLLVLLIVQNKVENRFVPLVLHLKPMLIFVICISNADMICFKQFFSLFSKWIAKYWIANRIKSPSTIFEYWHLQLVHNIQIRKRRKEGRKGQNEIRTVNTLCLALWFDGVGKWRKIMAPQLYFWSLRDFGTSLKTKKDGSNYIILILSID